MLHELEEAIVKPYSASPCMFLSYFIHRLVLIHSLYTRYLYVMCLCVHSYVHVCVSVCVHDCAHTYRITGIFIAKGKLTNRINWRKLKCDRAWENRSYLHVNLTCLHSNGAYLFICVQHSILTQISVIVCTESLRNVNTYLQKFVMKHYVVKMR